MDKDSIEIVSLKEHFTPVGLVTQLNQLVNEKIIIVDWNQGVIYNKKERQNLIIARHKLRRKKSTPDYMKTEKLEINKPHI